MRVTPTRNMSGSRKQNATAARPRDLEVAAEILYRSLVLESRNAAVTRNPMSPQCGEPSIGGNERGLPVKADPYRRCDRTRGRVRDHRGPVRKNEGNSFAKHSGGRKSGQTCGACDPTADRASAGAGHASTAGTHRYLRTNHCSHASAFAGTGINTFANRENAGAHRDTGSHAHITDSAHGAHSDTATADAAPAAPIAHTDHQASVTTRVLARGFLERRRLLPGRKTQRARFDRTDRLQMDGTRAVEARDPIPKNAAGVHDGVDQAL
jgi:hypothetical protein